VQARPQTARDLTSARLWAVVDRAEGEVLSGMHVAFPGIALVGREAITPTRKGTIVL